MGTLFLLLALNFGISWLNCWAVGRSWYEAKALGGWPRLLTWCGAIQAAIGFSSVIGFAIGGLLHLAGVLPAGVVQGAVSLWYLLVIVPALSTGLVILVESWRAAMRERSWSTTAAAGYNTIAMANNLYGAADGIGKALEAVGKMLDGDDDSNIAVMAFGIVLAALASGGILTAVLVRRYASRMRSTSMFAQA
jgi:hypothetical protein